jgi:ribose 5-phosphate isomerase B
MAPCTILSMKIALGADHAGYELKERLKPWLAKQGIELADKGTVSGESVDYPDFAREVALEVTGGRADYGILVCGSGIGMSIAANKVPGARAANVCSENDARLSREHNNANILALGARSLDEAAARKIVEVFLHTEFAGGRHQRRVDKISELDGSSSK